MANLQRVLLPVEVAPLQSENLADSQPKAPCHNTRRSVGLWNVLENSVELLNCKRSRLTHSLRYVFYTHEACWVGLIGNQLPSHRAVEDHTHLILQVSLAFWREVESLEPLFDR
jgi:hypothetical protein